MNVTDAAAKLFELLNAGEKTFTSGFTQCLLPGLTAEELTALQNFHRVSLPEEVKQFYGRYNLATVTGGPEQDRARFYGEYWMLGLQQALIKKQMIAELAAEFFSDIAGSGDWLPFLQSESGTNPGYYLIDCFAAKNSADGQAPVLFMYSGAEPELRFSSLAAMFETFSAWLTDGALVTVEGRVDSNNSADRKQLARIAAALNPDVEYWQDWL